MTSAYQIVERGAPFSLAYRVFWRAQGGNVVSAWHDIPLVPDQSKPNVYNMVCEVPRWTNAKMEIATAEKLGPIKQDVKKGKLRFVNNCFPHHGYIWNYGALPQTWEDPEHKDKDTDANGDNDPIDVCEIGSRVAKRGDVYQVKILGTLALIDEGETDWKLIAIDTRDKLAEHLNSVTDVDKYFPGLLKATHEWFRNYKIPTGKPANKFAFDGQYKDRKYAHDVIEQTHNFWKQLMHSGNPKLDITNTTLNNAATISPQDAEALVNATATAAAPEEPIPPEVDEVSFIENDKVKSQL